MHSPATSTNMSDSQDQHSCSDNNNHHHHHQQQQQDTNPSPQAGKTSSYHGSNAANRGLYDADKCRAHIANRIKISKIDRFSAQIGRAMEIESQMQSRLANLNRMFVACSAQACHDFTSSCYMGLRRHRQDRILNQQRKPSANKYKKQRTNSADNFQDTNGVTAINRQYSISNDLLYGPGAQLVQTLLMQSSGQVSTPATTNHGTHWKHSRRKLKNVFTATPITTDSFDTSTSSNVSDVFDPSLFVKRLSESIEANMQTSKDVLSNLLKLRQLFRTMASEHRDRVDLVYAAEEERQAATVIRRSAYNLSMAAIKATTTPIHVNLSESQTIE